jgi:hypothetical protein
LRKNLDPLLFPGRLRNHRNTPIDRDSLQALKNMIEQAGLILETCPPLPENPTGRTRELLRSAIALSDDLIGQASGKYRSNVS